MRHILSTLALVLHEQGLERVDLDVQAGEVGLSSDARFGLWRSDKRDRARGIGLTKDGWRLLGPFRLAWRRA